MVLHEGEPHIEWALAQALVLPWLRPTGAFLRLDRSTHVVKPSLPLAVLTKAMMAAFSMDSLASGLQVEEFVVLMDFAVVDARISNALTDPELVLDVHDAISLLHLANVMDKKDGEGLADDERPSEAGLGFVYSLFDDKVTSWTRVSRAVELAIGPSDQLAACCSAILPLWPTLASFPKLDLHVLVGACVCVCFVLYVLRVSAA